MNRIRLGVIGCGNVLSAYRMPIDKLRMAGAVDVAIACGRESQKEMALNSLGNIRFTTNSKDVLESPEVDLVLVLTSMPEHAAIALAALEAGKHVLIEKPMATHLEDADKLINASQQNKRHLVCAPFTILSPTFQTMGRRIKNNDIGQPCLARARYGWAGPWWSEWFYKTGGGSLFDLGVYCINSLTGLLGPVKRVTAMAGVAIPERQINGKTIKVQAEDNAQVLLDFGNNCFAVITSGFTMQQYRTPALEIYGTTGTIQMLGDDWDPDGYELWQNSAEAWQVFKETQPDWNWTDGLPHFIECLRGDKQPLVRPEHSRHVLEVMLKAQKSAREGKALAIESNFEPLDFREPASNEPAHLMHDRSREHTS
jgi:predicted dehydrogenase